MLINILITFLELSGEGLYFIKNILDDDKKLLWSGKKKVRFLVLVPLPWFQCPSFNFHLRRPSLDIRQGV